MINKQKQELSELLVTRDKLFSIIAHDLKSPFNSILGFSDILLNDLESLEQAQIKSFINEIKESAVSTFDLLNNLLVWAKSQSDG